MQAAARRQLNNIRRVGYIRSKSSSGTASATTTAAPPRVEYPKSFAQHARNQTSHAFKIGMTFLTLSLSVQLVNAKHSEGEARSEMESLYARIYLLEKTLLENEIELPSSITTSK